MRAGDSILFRKPAPPALTVGAADFLTYRLHGAEAYTMNAAAGANWNLIQATPAVTALWKPGRYRMIGSMVDHLLTAQQAKRIPIYDDWLEVGINPDTTTTAQDFRSHAERMLDAIERVMEGRAGSDLHAYQIAGMSITKMMPRDLMGWRDYYRSQVANEKMAKAGRSGLIEHKFCD